MQKQGRNFVEILKLNLKLAIWVAVINCIWGLLAVKLFSISSLPKGFMVAVVLSTFLVAIFAANAFFLLNKFFTRGIFLYNFLGLSFFILSNFPAFEASLPDGSPMPINFPILVLPMHLCSAIFHVFLMPKKAQTLPL
jgi:hypothetical protein